MSTFQHSGSSLRRDADPSTWPSKLGENEIERVLDIAFEGIWLMDAEARTSYVNPCVAELLGYTPEEMLGRSAFEFMFESDRDDAFSRLGQRRLGIGEQADFRLRHKNGSELWVRYKSTPIHDSTGEVVAVVNLLTDITEQKQVEAELRESRHQLSATLESYRSRELAASHEQAQALSRRLVEIQESERRHLARELHDEIGQGLTGIKLTLDLLARSASAEDRAKLEAAMAAVGEFIARVRNLSLDLRPALLDDLGLLPALLCLFDRYTAQTGVDVVFDHRGLHERLASSVETSVYRIVQEALTNVARHADVRRVVVGIRVDPATMEITIEDTGRGFDLAQALAAPTTGGLLGMRERAKLVGGILDIQSSPGGGARIVARIPIRRAGE